MHAVNPMALSPASDVMVMKTTNIAMPAFSRFAASVVMLLR
jgi:hypothetical protein